MSVHVSYRLADSSGDVADRLQAWDDTGFAARLWSKDPTLWFDEPQAELVDRLGWLDLAARLTEQLEELDRFGAEVSAAGFHHVVVLGMGGSSLAPEVYQATFGNAPGYPELLVLDSTHPAAVAAVAAAVDLDTTLFIVSSKSGTTLETLSFFRYFWDRVVEITAEPGAHFVAVTDPGSTLEELAAERGFRRTFLAPPDVGGRYSALTEFGLVPGAAIGADLAALEAAATEATARSGPSLTASESAGLRLGAALGELTLAGHDKVTFVTADGLAGFPAWIEQLIAESTGKDQTGIVPVGGEPVADASAYGSDRTFVIIDFVADPLDDVAAALSAAGHPVITVRLDTSADLVGAMFVFEVAVAAAGAVLGIHPFNQPDVQLAKELARRAMDGDLDTADVVEHNALEPGLEQTIRTWLAGIGPGEYVGIHAYLAPTPDTAAILQDARLAIRDGRHVATTLDFGPRFLHSTGQLHKGGPSTGRFLQVIDHPQPTLAVPETDYDFGELVGAQALGDHQALRGRGRSVLLVDIGGSGATGLTALRDAVVAAARG
jgi:transaldolase/glucose-6-phosphate isomerase